MSDQETGIKRNPEAQGRDIPGGWEKTVSKPLPVARCGATARSTGKRCNRWGLAGSTKVRELEDGTVEVYGTCQVHGGQIPNVKKYSAGMVEAARLRLLGMSDMAIDTIEDLAQNGTSEQVRLKSAETILDRIGVRAGTEIDVSGEVTHTVETAADRTRAALAATALRMRGAEEDPKVINAEDFPDTQE